MRLTLRTLLAYLDNTLEPADAEILRQKLEQSGFATQLVQRIRGSIADPNLSAPAPDSVHPIEEPNMMSNYLDSTLSPEQVAEIEKACLESLPHLAEAAACHQILTLVLGKPAEVTDELRDRIVSMVDADGNTVVSEPLSGAMIAGEIGPRYSNLDVPGGSDAAEQFELPPQHDATIDPTAMPELAGAAPSASQQHSSSHTLDQPPEQVRPVGVDDSGVFQAATKLREQSQQFAGAGTALDDAGSIAGSRPLRELERSDFYEGDVRTSRITPWLVTLALVATLLFAISQIFAPLIGPKKTAQNDDQGANAAAVAGTDTDVTEADGADAPERTADEESDTTGSAKTEATENSDAMETETQVNAETETANESDATASEASAEDSQNVFEDTDGPPVPGGLMVETSDDAPPVPPGLEDVKPASEEVAADADAAAGPADETVAMLPNETVSQGSVENVAQEAAMDTPAVEEIAKEAPIKDAPKEDAASDATPLAQFVSENALVAQWIGNGDDAEWTLLAPKEGVIADATLVCAPEYRAEFSFPGDNETQLTLVGPTRVRVLDGPHAIDLRALFGTGIIRFSEPRSRISLTTRQATLVVTAESAGAEIAFDVRHQRELGADPLVPANHQTQLELFGINGNVSLEGFTEAISLQRGMQVVSDVSTKRQPVAETSQPERPPAWIDPDVDTGSLEAEAAAALLELVRSDSSGSLMLSLRVALGFRRNEVAALAGKTMLALGDASAYFGVDGLLSNEKQRLYWSSHLDAIRDMLNRSVPEAAAVRTAIAGQNVAMDNADGDTLFRLLIGYSQDQLKTGGDAELVADLESASMPVRVLASEHLRDISGTTLFFRPEEEVASRREEVVKKWKVRLRKESIRYPNSE